MLLSRDDLHTYQRRSVRFLKDTPRCALWQEMGLGKTVATLTALRDLQETFDVDRTLIIAPLRVARATWPAEIERWSHLQGMTYRVLAGHAAPTRTRLALEDASGLHIINRELVPWLVKLFQDRRRAWPYDAVVIDEASSFKSHRAARFKALRKVLPRVTRLIELTGTPTSNGLLDLWAQVALLDGGERLGRTYTQFRDRYFVPDYMGYNWTPREGAQEAIEARLSDIVLSMSAADYLDMPPLIINDLPVALPPAAQVAYRTLEREFLVELDGRDVAVFNAAALSNKLLQCANGAVYTDDSGAWADLHDAKLGALEEIVEGIGGVPLLVAYNFRSDAARIAARFPQAELLMSDPAQIARWNAGGIDMLLAHPASAGHGLNLQRGGRHLAWFGLNWSLELYQQFNARLHRQGQTGPVICHRIIAEDTIDRTLLAALAGKHMTQAALLAALKEDALRRSGNGGLEVVS